MMNNNFNNESVNENVNSNSRRSITQLSTGIDDNSQTLSKINLITSKRTPRFSTKNNKKSIESEKLSLINNSQHNENVQQIYTINVPNVTDLSSKETLKLTEELRLINDFDDVQSDFDRSQEINLKINFRKEILDERGKKNTINVTNTPNIKLDLDVSNAPKLVKDIPPSNSESDSYFYNKEKMSQCSSELLASSESSTEKDSVTDDDKCTSLKPSPIHQVVLMTSPKIQSQFPSKSIVNYKSQYQRPDLDSSPWSKSISYEELNPKSSPNQIKYSHRQTPKSCGYYTQPINVGSPRQLVVPGTGQRQLATYSPGSNPRSSLDDSLHDVVNRHMSNSSSESSSNQEYQRTLSNSNNHNQSTNSPGSDSSSFLSINSNHQMERIFQKNGSNRRLSSRSKFEKKFGTLPRNKENGDVSSLSSGYIQMNGFLPQSRSYNNLNAITSPIDSQKQKWGSLANIGNKKDSEYIDRLYSSLQHCIDNNNYEGMKDIVMILLHGNEHDGIDDIADHFQGKDRIVIMEMLTTCDHALKRTESIFDMKMIHSDLCNNLRSGLSDWSINDHSDKTASSTEKMVIWRADTEEFLPPPLKPLPRPMPTNLLKSAIISQETLQLIDRKVAETLDMEPSTFTELIMLLTNDYSKDVEKVRALFRWITTYDLRHISFDHSAPIDSLIGVLRAVKSGQMSYNELFFRMCRYSGIHCQFICGYSKGAGYRPGMEIRDGNTFRNVWTSVYVAGAWRLMNCNWGSRCILTKCHTNHCLDASSSNNAHLQSDEFYFLTDPKQHIFEHFPDKKRWQLLNRPITIDQFLSLPIVKSPFFNANLSFKRNYPETLETKNGKVTVKINMPKQVGIKCLLESKEDNTVIRGSTLVRVLETRVMIITVVPPHLGTFYLSIYVHGNWKSETTGELACSFRVVCSAENYERDETGKFPDIGVVGATPIAPHLGVIVTGAIDPFVIWDERSTMKLNLITNPGLRIRHHFLSHDRSSQTATSCDSYALLQCHGQGRHQYHIRFPFDTFFSLTIYAGIYDNQLSCSSFSSSLSSIANSDQSLECVYRLLVDCRYAQEKIAPFPRQSSRWVGFKLIEPVSQYLELDRVYRFRILSGLCSGITVVIKDHKWYDLITTGEGLWKGKIHTGLEIGNLTVYGKFDSTRGEEEFIKLLDYDVVGNGDK